MSTSSLIHAYENARVIHKVLSEYYGAEATQSEIARQLGISTSKVNRLLQSGRRQGMVQISLHAPYQHLFDLATRLEQTFQLTVAEVVPCSAEDGRALLSSLGIIGARYLLEHLQDGDVIAIGGGTTIHAIVEAMQPSRAYKVDVVPAVGGVQGCATTDVNFLADRLAERLGGRSFHLHAPAFAESPKQRDELLNMGPIRDILNIARGARIALLGIGTVDPESSRFIQFTALSAEDMKQIAMQHGGIGEVLAFIYDRSGKPCAQPYGERVVGLTMEELQSIPLRIGAAGSRAKAAALLGALRGRYLHTLVTDEKAAEKVMEFQMLDQGS
ncbi:MAG: sugar-binding transcriptional regulator [Anaerolineales bacterium]